jgi:hypothetical protein
MIVKKKIKYLSKTAMTCPGRHDSNKNAIYKSSSPI